VYPSLPSWASGYANAMLIFANVIGLGRPQILNIDVTSKVTVLHLKQRILTHVRGRIIVMLFNGRPLMDNNATIDTLHFSKECTVQVNCARLTDDSVDVFAANHITGPEADAGANSKSSSSNADQHQDTYVLAEPGSNPIDPTVRICNFVRAHCLHRKYPQMSTFHAHKLTYHSMRRYVDPDCRLFSTTVTLY